MFFGVLLAGAIGLGATDNGLVLPLLATQILWINLVTDGAPALALGIDPADVEVMSRRPRPRHERVITPSMRSEEHTSELQSLMRNSYAVFCLKKKKKHK